MSDFLSDLGAAQAQDSGSAPAGGGDFLSQLSAAQTQDEQPSSSSSGATLGSAIEYGLVNAVPFGKDIGAAVGAAESYLPTALRAPGDVANNVASGDTFGQRFSKTKAMIQAQDAANQQAYPITSLATPLVVSAAALPIAGPVDAISGGLSSIVPRLAPLAADTLATGAVGAGYGALYGAGSGDTLDQRIANAENGALYGGVGGAAVPAVARGASSLANAALIPFKGAEELATNRIAQAISQDRALGKTALSPSDFAAAQATGQPAMVADIGGQATRRLARTAANASPEADEALSGPINERYEDQGPRLANFLQGLFGNNLNAQATRDALAAKASATNSPAYAQAYADGANGVWTPGLENLVNSPNVQAAIKGATQTAANDAVLTGTPVVRNPFVLDANGNLTLAADAQGNRAIPTLQFWDLVKRGLDDQIGSAFSGGQKATGAQLVQLKNQLLSNLDAAVPSYATARQGAFQMFGAQNALEAGENFLKMANTANTAQAKAALQAMTPAQRALFSQGLASQMAQAALNAPARRNVISMFNSPEVAERLQLGLGPQIANQVEAFLRRESAMDMLRTAVGGNSTTARQASDLEQAGHGILGIAKSAVSSPIAGAAAGATAGYHEHGFDPIEIGKYAAAGALAGIMGKYFTGQNARLMASIGEQLASPDPTAVNAAIKRIAQNPRAMNALRAAQNSLTYLAASKAQSLPSPFTSEQPSYAQ